MLCVDIEVCGRLTGHPWEWFSAGAIFSVRGDRGGKKVRAVVDAVEMSAVLCKGRFHFLMNFLKVFLVDEPPADAGLIGDDDRQETGCVDFAHRIETVRKDLYQSVRVGITDVPVYGPVSVQEDRSFFHPKYSTPAL